jgi:hypothetical protein
MEGIDMWTKPTGIFIILVCIAGFIQVSAAQCRKARGDEVPHGANMFVQMSNRTVPNIRGKISFPDGDPLKDVVVEIFRYAGGEGYADIQKALLQKRIAACVTLDDGTFSFRGLRPGMYLLRAGTSYAQGMNESHIIVLLKPGVRKDKGAGLEMTLSLGT